MSDEPKIEVVKARSIFAPNPWRHPVRAFRMWRFFRRLREDAAYLSTTFDTRTRGLLEDAETDTFLFGSRGKEARSWHRDGS